MTAPSRLPRAVIFDWDNTLIDSWAVIEASVNVTLEAMGHQPWTPEEIRDRVRHSLRNAFPPLFGDQPAASIACSSNSVGTGSAFHLRTDRLALNSSTNAENTMFTSSNRTYDNMLCNVIRDLTPDSLLFFSTSTFRHEFSCYNINAFFFTTTVPAWVTSANILQNESRRLWKIGKKICLSAGSVFSPFRPA